MCGYSFIPTLYMKIILLIKGEYIYTCPQCQGKLYLKMTSFVFVKKREKIDKTELWRKC